MSNKPVVKAVAPRQVGLGDVWGMALSATVHTLSGVDRVAQTFDEIAGIALDKAVHFSESVSINDNMTLARLRADQAAQLVALQAAGYSVSDDRLTL